MHHKRAIYDYALRRLLTTVMHVYYSFLSLVFNNVEWSFYMIAKVSSLLIFLKMSKL